jgi:hypothetical protein
LYYLVGSIGDVLTCDIGRVVCLERLEFRDSWEGAGGVPYPFVMFIFSLVCACVVLLLIYTLGSDGSLVFTILF